jgi:hypothetical protein
VVDRERAPGRYLSIHFTRPDGQCTLIASSETARALSVTAFSALLPNSSWSLACGVRVVAAQLDPPSPLGEAVLRGTAKRYTCALFGCHSNGTPSRWRERELKGRTLDLRRSKMPYLCVFQWGLTDTLSAADCFPLYPIVRRNSKTISSATKAVAASSAMLPLVTPHTVASERGVGGRMDAVSVR